MSQSSENDRNQAPGGQSGRMFGRGQPDDERKSAVFPGCLTSIGFVLLAFMFVVNPVRDDRIAFPITLGVLAAAGIPLLFVRRWAIRGIGIGLLFSWGFLTLVSGGICTGLAYFIYS